MKDPDEVRELLNRKTRKLLDQYSMTPDRKLKAAIRKEIEDTLDIYGISEDEASLSLFGVSVKTDRVGGKRLHVELESANGKRYSIPVTRHLHDLKEVGPFSPEVIEENVRSKLDDYALREEDIQTALDDCFQVLRDRGIINTKSSEEED